MLFENTASTMDTSVLGSFVFHRDPGYNTWTLRIFDNHKKIHRMLGIFPYVNQKVIVNSKLLSKNSIAIAFIENVLL
jgi:hypothetical protein